MTVVEQCRIVQSDSLEWLDAEEAAGHLKIKPRTLLLWTRQGKIKGYALSGAKRHRWRYRREDLDAALLGASVVSSEMPSVLNEGRMK